MAVPDWACVGEFHVSTSPSSLVFLSLNLAPHEVALSTVVADKADMAVLLLVLRRRPVVLG
jgi:hypothetical protein